VPEVITADLTPMRPKFSPASIEIAMVVLSFQVRVTDPSVAQCIIAGRVTTPDAEVRFTQPLMRGKTWTASRLWVSIVSGMGGLLLEKY